MSTENETNKEYVEEVAEVTPLPESVTLPEPDPTDMPPEKAAPLYQSNDSHAKSGGREDGSDLEPPPEE